MAQTTNDDIEPHHHTNYPEGSPEDKQINEEILKDKSRPLEDLPVVYMDNPKDSKLRPAYARYLIDGGSYAEAIYYVWKGIVLDHKQVPEIDVFYISRRMDPEIDVSRWPQTRIREIEPPLFYYKPAGDDKYYRGFWDTTFGIFYQWKETGLKEDQLPRDAFPSKILYMQPLPTGASQTRSLTRIMLIDPPPK